MRLGAVMVIAGALFVSLPASAFAQERPVQEVQQEGIIPEVPVAEQPVAEESQPEAGLEVLRRAEAEYAMTGADIKEMAVGSADAEGMAAADNKIVLSTTTVIIVLLVLILIT
jgi:hypothetical protein